MAARQVREDRDQAAMTQAWFTALYTRVDKMPSLARVLHVEPETQTPAQMRAILGVLATEYGWRVMKES